MKIFLKGLLLNFLKTLLIKTKKPDFLSGFPYIKYKQNKVEMRGVEPLTS